MRQQSLLYTVLKWSSIVIVALLVSVFLYSVFLYQDIEESKTNDFATSEKRILEETEITEIESISRYHGQVYYNVVEGSTNTGEKLLGFVAISDEPMELEIFELSDLIDKSSLEEKWRDSCAGSCELLQSQYGIRDEIPLLEVSYFDEKDRLSYAYYRLKDGSYDSGVSFSNDY